MMLSQSRVPYRYWHCIISMLRGTLILHTLAALLFLLSNAEFVYKLLSLTSFCTPKASDIMPLQCMTQHTTWSDSQQLLCPNQGKEERRLCRVMAISVFPTEISDTRTTSTIQSNCIGNSQFHYAKLKQEVHPANGN